MIRDTDYVPDLQPPSRPYQEMKKTQYPLSPAGVASFYTDSCAPVVRRFVIKGYDLEQVREAAHDVYIDLLGKVNNLRQEPPNYFTGASVFGWVTQAVNWRLHNLNRGAWTGKKILMSSIDQKELPPNTDASIEEAEDRVLLQGILERLPVKEKLVLVGRYIEDLESSEIAIRMGISVSQAHYYAAWGLKHARTILEEGRMPKRGRPQKKA